MRNFLLNLSSKIRIRSGTYDLSGKQTVDIYKQLIVGDILLKGNNKHLDSIFRDDYSFAGIYIGNGNVAISTKDGITTEDIVTFCRCDTIMIWRLVWHLEERLEIIDRCIRRVNQFIEYTRNYYCRFIGIDHELYSLDIVDACYKELIFHRTNNKLSSNDLMSCPSLHIIYTNNTINIEDHNVKR